MVTELAYQKALTLEGWQLTPQTTSGTGAIGQFELESIYDTEVVTEILKSSPSLIILDSGRNGGEKGLELCKRIREKTKQNIKKIPTQESIFK